jgi:hypothetical protein
MVVMLWFREMCMDLISLETEEENQMVEAIMTKAVPRISISEYCEKKM